MEIKVLKQFTLKKTLNNTSPDSWIKIEIANSWDDFTQAFRQNNHLVFIGNTFISEEVRADFNRFMNGHLNRTIDNSWDDIMRWFKDAQKLFPNNHDLLASQEAYEFLKKYVGNCTFNIRYFPGFVFPQEEFRNELELVGNLELQQQVEILIQQNAQLQTQNQQIIANLNQTLAQVNITNSQLNQQVSQQQQVINQLQTELNREKDKNKHLLEQLTQIQIPPK